MRWKQGDSLNVRQNWNALFASTGKSNLATIPTLPEEHESLKQGL
jgi:hypothetical protein